MTTRPKPAPQKIAPATNLPKVILKEIEWLGHLPKMLALPPAMKSEGGKELHRLQIGEDPNDWGPMSSIGSGANEIRLQDANGWYRIFYVAKFLEVIYVLGIVTKKTNQTSKQDVDNAKVKYKEAEAQNAIKKQAHAAAKPAKKAKPKTAKETER